MNQDLRIKNFPISFFSVVLGLSGLTIAYQKAEHVLAMPFQISNLLLLLSILVFLTITFAYLVKIVRYPSFVRTEFNHPMKMAFFPTFSISLLMLSITLLENFPLASYYLWLVGGIIQLSLTVKIIAIWMQQSKFEIKHLSPAWFIPAVGNIIVPVAGVSHASPEISWFFFSLGLLFWLVLTVLFFNRIIFHAPLEEKLLPTLFILIAPPAVGFISFVKLTGAVDEFARILYYIGFFMTILVFAQWRLFQKIRFYLSWWAFSFPISAITIASILMYRETGLETFKYVSFTLFTLLNLLVIALLLKTALAIGRNQICVEEG